MKVCSLYGAGFYYMPGTDMCIKIGGWMRAEITGGQMNGNITWGPYADAVNTRATSDLVERARGYITADAREQTAYGVARAYIDVGISTNDTSDSIGGAAGGNSGEFSSNRAYLQWAGFTAGLATSFFDFYSAPAPLYRAGYLPNEDTGDGGQWVWAYTAQLGGGVTATLSAEARRWEQIINVGAGTGTAPALGSYTSPAPGGTYGAGYGGWQVPDIVANLRVDQAWGGAQIMGALHEDNALYYGASSAAVLPSSGHPGDAWGWVVGAGLKLNAPMIAQGDYFQGEVNYTVGALRYLNIVEPSWDESSGANQVWGVMSDCVYGGTIAAGNNTNCEQTSAWEVTASYEHYWTPQWHQSIVGAYEAVSYSSTANALLCAGEWGQALAAAGTGVSAGCNNNWSMWGVGSRLQWDVTKSFYIGVEAMYEELNGANGGAGGLPTGVILTGSGATTQVNSMGDWQFTLRMHKDFLP